MKLKIFKNILVIAGGHYISGAEKVTLEVMQGLKEEGHRLFCISSGWTDGVFSSHLTKLDIKFKQIKLGWYYLSNLKWSLDSLIHYPSSFIIFYKFIKQNEYQAVYTISYRYVVLLYPLLKKNIIYHVHDPNSHSRQSRFFLRLIDKKIIKYIAVSEFIKKDLIECGIDANKIEVIYNGIKISEKIPAKININPNHITIGIVGQVIRRKGHEDVLKAMKILREMKLSVSLIIVGARDKEFVEKLELFILENNLTSTVEWRDFKESLFDIYKGIDVVVAATRNEEPFGLIAIEANMLELPVIVSKKGGLVEIVNDAYNGFVVDAYCPQQIADKIFIFYHNPDLKIQMGKNGRARVIEKFSIREMNNKIAAII